MQIIEKFKSNSNEERRQFVTQAIIDLENSNINETDLQLISQNAIKENPAI